MPNSAEPLLLESERSRRIVDGVRAIGILLVILFHVMFGVSKLLQEYGEEHDDYAGLDALVAGYPQALNIAWQALGSEVIFVISGFLLSYLLFRELTRTDRVDLRDYLVRRVSRILPLYAVGLTLYAFAARWEWWELGLNLVFVSKIFDAETIIPVGWSLEVMIQVYLVLPFLCAWLHRRRLRGPVILGLIALSLLPRFLVLNANPADYASPFHALVYGGDATETQEDLYYLLLHRATPFLAGLYIAHLVIYRQARLRALFGRPATGTASLVLGAAILIGSGSLPIHDRDSFLYADVPVEFWLWFWAFQRAVFTLGLALVILPVFYGLRGLPRAVGSVLALDLWRPVSHGIYSIYLFHFACMIPAAAIVLLPWHRDRLAVLFSEPDNLDEAIGSISNFEILLIFLLTSFFAVKLAGWLTRVVEKPSQAWIRKRYGREPAPAAAGRAPTSERVASKTG